MDAAKQWALEGLVNGLERLGSVLGEAAGVRLERVRAELLGAVAARDKGDPAEVKSRIGRAMEELAILGESLDPAEGMAMRALAEQFVSGLDRGDSDAVERNLDEIQARTGRPKERKEM